MLDLAYSTVCSIGMSSSSSEASGDDPDTSSTAQFPSLADVIELVQKGAIAPSFLSGAFDPKNPTADEKAKMCSSRTTVLPILSFLANKSVHIVGTYSWHRVDVLQFAIGPTWSERFPLLVIFDSKNVESCPVLPANLDDYNSAFTPRGRLRPTYWIMSLWVEAGHQLVRWDLTNETYAWQRRAIIDRGPALFGVSIPEKSSSISAPAVASATGRLSSSAAAAKSNIRCELRCDFVLHGMLACGVCPDMRCNICDLSPELGDAVRLPGHAGCIAYTGCRHLDVNLTAGPVAAAEHASLFSDALAEFVEEAVPLPMIVGGDVLDVTGLAAVPNDQSFAADAAINNVPELQLSHSQDLLSVSLLEFACQPVISVDTPQVPVRDDPVSPRAAEADCVSERRSEAASGRESVDSSEADDDANEQLPAESGAARDGGPRADHIEDAKPVAPVGPRPGFPDLTLGLWMPHKEIALTSSTVTQLERFLDAENRIWEADDTVVETTTMSSLVTSAERALLKPFFTDVEHLITSTMPACSWHSEFAVTEVRLLRHRAYGKSALQALNRRSEISQSRHLCCRILLRHFPGVTIVHNNASMTQSPCVLAQNGAGVWWWNVLGGCVFWGDDPLAALVSEATEPLSRSEAANALAAGGVADEVFVFWTKQTTTGRVGTIGKGSVIVNSKPPDSPMVRSALFGTDQQTINNLEKWSASVAATATLEKSGLVTVSAASPLLHWIARNRFFFRSMAHFSICLKSSCPHLRFVFTIDRNGDVYWPLAVDVQFGSLLVHGSVDSLTLSIYEKKPPKVPAVKRPPPPRMLTPVQFTSFDDVSPAQPSQKARKLGALPSMRLSAGAVAGHSAAASDIGESLSSASRNAFVDAVQTATSAALQTTQVALSNAHETTKSALQAAMEVQKLQIGVLMSELHKCREELDETKRALAVAQQRYVDSDARVAVEKARVDEYARAAEVAGARLAVASEHIMETNANAPAYEAQRLGMTLAAVCATSGKGTMAFPTIPAAPERVTGMKVLGADVKPF